MLNKPHKIFALGKGLFFQTLSAGSKSTAPWKRTLYAEMLEYCPEAESF
jgi:hypothetical protein